MPSLLHVGCGSAPRPECFGDFDEVRLDISPECQPDIVASMTRMGDIGPFGAVFSSHSLEHLYPHEVPIALAELHRVLEPGGRAMILVPDLEDVRPTDDLLYVSSSGPICGLDLYYGHSRLIPSQPHMAHHCGFTAPMLQAVLEAAGFSQVTVIRAPAFNLIATAVK